MVFQRLVAPTATTVTSLAGHLPPFFTINITRVRRCLIVGWSHQRLPGSLFSDSRGYREGRENEVSRSGPAQKVCDGLSA